MAQIRFRFLGTFEIGIDATPVTSFHSDKARALLAYLALEPQEHSRQELAAFLWPEIGEQHARANLRNTLHRLRQTLDTAAPGAAGQLLAVSRRTVQFNSDCAWVDVHRFQRLIDEASAHSSEQRPSHATTVSSPLTQLEEALKLYRGELLWGFGVVDAPAFDEWLLLRREMLQQRAILAFHTLVTELEAVGDHEKAHAVTNRLLALDPYREETHRQLMRLLAQLGRPDQALQQFEQMQQLLRSELEAAPSEETIALAKQIAAGEYTSDEKPQPETVEEQTPDPESGQQSSTSGEEQADPTLPHPLTPCPPYPST